MKLQLVRPTSRRKRRRSDSCGMRRDCRRAIFSGALCQRAYACRASWHRAKGSGRRAVLCLGANFKPVATDARRRGARLYSGDCLAQHRTDSEAEQTPVSARSATLFDRLARVRPVGPRPKAVPARESAGGASTHVVGTTVAAGRRVVSRAVVTIASSVKMIALETHHEHMA